MESEKIKSRSRSPIHRRSSESDESYILRRQTRDRQRVSTRRRTRSRSVDSRGSASSRKSPSDEDSGRSRRRFERHSRRRQNARRPKARSASPLDGLLRPTKDNRDFCQKLALTADGKWTNELEMKWKLAEADEAVLQEHLLDELKKFTADPEEHPKYGDEWTSFWERRYKEIEKQDKNPEAHNYVPEWKKWWGRRLRTLLQQDTESKIRAAKKEHGVDYETLSQLRKNVNPPGTIATTNIKSEPVDEVANGKVKSGEASGNIKIKTEGGELAAAVCEKPFDSFRFTWQSLTGVAVGQISPPTPTYAVPFLSESCATGPALQPNQRSSLKEDDKNNPSDVNVVQSLRSLCENEEYLGSMTPVLTSYYKRAEALETERNGGSVALLDDTEFVSVLFQAREKLRSLIRANIKDPLRTRKLNVLVYELNILFDAPQCRDFRMVLPTNTEPSQPATVAAGQSASNKQMQASVNADNLLLALGHKTSQSMKMAIAAEITKYILRHHRKSWKKMDLRGIVLKLLLPALSSNENEQKKRKPETYEEGASLPTQAVIKTERKS